MARTPVAGTGSGVVSAAKDPSEPTHDCGPLPGPGMWQSAPAKRFGLPAAPMISALAASAILAVLVQIYAGAALRGMYADGASFATMLAAHQLFVEPTRAISSLISQWPVMAAMRLGAQTPHSIAMVYSLITNLLPGLIVLLCLPALPACQRHFFIFPAFVYFAGTLSAQFSSAAEGLVATSYFWLLLCLITFGALTTLRLALIAVLTAGTLRLHEQMLFLGPILFVSCAIRWRNEPRLLPRIVLSVAAVCSLASSAIAAHDVLYPWSVEERGTAIADFLTFWWLYRPEFGYNLPAVLGILAVPCVLLTTVRPVWGPWIFGALSIPLALAAFWLDWLIAPYTQYAARYNGALMSLPLATIFLLARVYAPLATATTGRPAMTIVVLLGLTVSLCHVAATNQWSLFLTQFSKVLQSQDGIIPWETVVMAPESRQAKLAANIGWPWTNPDLSLVALPRSCVNSVIANPTWYNGWEPHNLSNLATMPAIPGVTYTYLLPTDQQPRVLCNVLQCPCLNGMPVKG
jgi:hypothetical protein